jgi:endo-alpha-1,4-polygalactosaminidase (GH114 family)
MFQNKDNIFTASKSASKSANRLMLYLIKPTMVVVFHYLKGFLTLKIFSSKKMLHITFPIFLILTGIPLCFLPGLIAGVSAASAIWQPNASAPIHWQWQIGTPFNTSTDQLPGVTVYDIDAYDNAASVVSALHAKGFIVIAYVSFGTYENWRPDAAGFPANVKGSSNGWPGENWLDIRSDTVKTIMAARLDLIKSKGFDAVEPDNVDGYSNSTGFPLTAQDQLNYNEWIAAQCHLRGLSVGLKNDIDQVTTLQPYFDWTLNEESYKYNEYSGLSAFTGNNKAVFEVEYGKSTPQASALNALHFNSMTRDLDLVSPSSSGYVRLPCIPDTQNSW